MAISLQKGQRVSLSKESKEGLDRVIVGLGWDEARQPQTKGFLASLFGGGEPGQSPLQSSEHKCFVSMASRKAV